MSVQGQFYLAFLLLVAGMQPYYGADCSGPAGPVPADDVCGVIEHVDVGLIYAIVAHHAYQATATTPSRAGLAVGGSTGRRWCPMCWPMLRTVVATAALAAILSCGALIGVANFRAVGWYPSEPRC